MNTSIENFGSVASRRAADLMLYQRLIEAGWEKIYERASNVAFTEKETRSFLLSFERPIDRAYFRVYYLAGHWTVDQLAPQTSKARLYVGEYAAGASAALERAGVLGPMREGRVEITDSVAGALVIETQEDARKHLEGFFREAQRILRNGSTPFMEALDVLALGMLLGNVDRVIKTVGMPAKPSLPGGLQPLDMHGPDDDDQAMIDTLRDSGWETVTDDDGGITFAVREGPTTYEVTLSYGARTRAVLSILSNRKATSAEVYNFERVSDLREKLTTAELIPPAGAVYS